MIPKHLADRMQVLDALPTATTLPEPWSGIAVRAVGGLTAIGFGASSDTLLILSSAGRGVIDCRDGTMLARDDDEDCIVDVGNLLAAGIGPLDGFDIRISGIYGGGLASRTADGWGVERHPLAWPGEELFVSPPGQSMLWLPPDTPMRLTKLGGFSAELRAFGFSPTGKAFVIATAADILIFGR
jgi:hypothetical protein